MDPGGLRSEPAHLSFANIRFVINLFLLYGDADSKLAVKRSAAFRGVIASGISGRKSTQNTLLPTPCGSFEISGI